MDAPLLREDRRTGVWIVALGGPLTPADAGRVIALVDKCLTNCPAAIVVDLRAGVFDGVSTSLLPALQRRADVAGVAVEFVADGELARRVRHGPIRHFVTVHHSVRQAVEAARRLPGRRWGRLRLASGPRASIVARSTITDLCLDWGLYTVLYSARLVMGELVDTMGAPDGTDIEVTGGVLTDFLHLRVRDCPPAGHGVPRGIRGLRLVGAQRGEGVPGVRPPLIARYATAWGSHCHADGRTVWATLRLPNETRDRRAPATAR